MIRRVFNTFFLNCDIASINEAFREVVASGVNGRGFTAVDNAIQILAHSVTENTFFSTTHLALTTNDTP